MKDNEIRESAALTIGVFLVSLLFVVGVIFALSGCASDSVNKTQSAKETALSPIPYYGEVCYSGLIYTPSYTTFMVKMTEGGKMVVCDE